MQNVNECLHKFSDSYVGSGLKGAMLEREHAVGEIGN
jgi:hypothetical protein